MTTYRFMLAAGTAIAALAIAAPSAAHPDHETREEVREVKIIKADGKRISKSSFVADCGKGRKFESSSSTGDDRNKNVSKMVICSDPGESDEAWAKTLSEALARVESNDDMPAEGKARIAADLRSELAKLGK